LNAPARTSNRINSLIPKIRLSEAHEALDMKCPSEVYTASTRSYRGIGEHTTRSTTRLLLSPTVAAYVLGTICYLCVRSGQDQLWRRGGTLARLS
jgi:hypothetical protein